MSVFAASAFSGRLQICIVGLLTICGLLLPLQRAWAQEVPVAADTSKPRLVVQVGHTAEVTSIAFSPNGKIVASASDDKTAKLWDSATGQLLRTLVGHNDGVESVAFSPDGKMLATGSADNTIKLWESATGRLLRTIKEDEVVLLVAFSPDGRTIADTTDGSLKLWDTDTGQMLQLIKEKKAVFFSIAFSPNGNFIAGATFDDTLKLWDVATGQLQRTFMMPGCDVTAVAFSPDGRAIAGGGLTETLAGIVELFDTYTGHLLKTLKRASDDVDVVAFSVDGKTIASAGEHSTINLWNVTTGQLQASVTTPDYFKFVVFSPNRRTVASASGTNTMKFWDPSTGHLVRTFTEQTKAIETIAISSDLRTIISTNGTNKVRFWDFYRGLLVRALTEHDFSVKSVAFNSNGRTFASASDDDTFRLWDATTGQLQRTITLPGFTDGTDTMAFSPDGRTIASSDAEKRINLWRVTTGRLRRTLTMPDYVKTIVFSPDGKILAGASLDNSIKIWNATTGQLQQTIKISDDVSLVAFSRNGKTLASAGLSNAIKLWSVDTGKITRTLTTHTGFVNAVAFSPDGKTLVSASDDHTVKLWDTDTGNLIRTLPGHPDDVLSVAFSKYGGIIAGAYENGTNEFWDAANGSEICSLYDFDHDDWAVVTPDGRFDGSPGGIDQLHYVVGLEPVDLAQLKDRYYEPGLLAKLMGYSKVPLRDVPPLDAIPLYPQIDDPVVALDARSATVHLTNRGGGIGRIVVQVNGKEIAHDARGAGINPTAKDATVTVQIPKALTVPGDKANHLEVVAYNADGGVASRGVVAVFTEPEAAPATPPRLFAVIAGVSDYADPSLHLNFAAKDARDMAQAMALGANRLFTGGTDIQLLTSDAGRSLKPGKDANGTSLASDIAVLPATKSGFTEAFAHIQAQHPNPATDVLILYLAGHGLSLATSTDSSLYCYLTQDATSGDKDSLRSADLRAATTVTSDDLADWTNTQIPILKQVIVLDTCAAGAAATKLSEKRDIDSDQVRAADRLNGRTGFWVLMGCAADRSSYEASRFSQGLLTYSLLDYMAQGKLMDGQVDVSAWFEHAEEEVPKLATDAVGGIQEPRRIVPKEARSFPVALLDADAQGRIPLARALPVVLRPVFLSDDFTDPLNLTGRVGKALSDLSESRQARGSDDAAKPSVDLIYMDADELPSAARPSGGYTVTGEGANATATVKITLTFSPAPGSSDAPRKVVLIPTTGGVGDETARQALAQKVAEAVAQAVGR